MSDTPKEGVKLTLIRPDADTPLSEEDGVFWTVKPKDSDSQAGLGIAYTWPSGKRVEAFLSFEQLHALGKIANQYIADRRGDPIWRELQQDGGSHDKA